MRRPTVGRGRQAGVTPNLLIAHLEKIAPEPSLPLASVNNQLMLKELKCMCSVLQQATGTTVWCTGVHQVPPGVDSSIWRCELSLLLWGWSLGFLPCQTSTRHDTPAAIGCFGTLNQTAAGMLRLVTTITYTWGGEASSWIAEEGHLYQSWQRHHTTSYRRNI